MNQPKTVTESDNLARDSAPSDPKKDSKPRRRFTPEEQIANREQEIARIKEKQKMRVRAQIQKAEEILVACVDAASGAGMEMETKLCSDALDALVGPRNSIAIAPKD